MSDTILAIPSSLPGGLDAEMSMHFGHCECYTLVKVQDGAVVSSDTLQAVPHQEGGCMAAVQHLVAHGVTALLAGGMGMRPLTGFGQAGIPVYHAAGMPTVRAAVDAYCKGALPQFTPQLSCRGHH